MPKVGMEPVRKAEAINAALECFCDNGIDKTTLEMVAQKAGFSKGIVAYYFKTKRQLTLECLKAFMSSYNLKIGSSITKDMTPEQMVKVVVDISLPPLDEESDDKINVSVLEGVEKICLPEKKIANLFGQFLSKSAIDDEIKTILGEIYAADIEGITKLIEYAKKAYQADHLDEKETAYALLAMIYGLSFFRIVGFMPPGEPDNRDVAFHYINLLLGINS
jgi:TetR/AcrR family transcriptional regulator, transcriptional repressor of bet genes